MLSILISLCTLCFQPVKSQEITPVSITISPRINASLPENFFQPFEDQYNVDVIVVTEFESLIGTPLYGIANYLDNLRQYASSADVLLVDDFNLSVVATRTGYILDLTHLINTDVSFLSTDFYEGASTAFYWDDRYWAYPLSLSIYGMAFNPTVLEQANIPLDVGNWSNENYQIGVDALSQVLDTPVIQADMPHLLLRSEWDRPFYDINNPLYEPDFEGLAPLIQAWQAVFSANMGKSSTWEQALSLEGKAHLRVNEEEQFAPYPNGKYGVITQGLAISGGTQNPELAYALIQYLSQSIEFINLMADDLPAKHQQTAIYSYFTQKPDAIQDQLLNAVTDAIYASDRQFGMYLDLLITVSSFDVEEQLPFIKQQISNDLQTAGARRTSDQITVADPRQPTNALSFGIFQSWIDSSNDPNRWYQLVEDFVANEPQISDLIFVNYNQSIPFQQYLDQLDCSFGFSPSDLSQFLPLSPLMSVDSNFNADNFITGVLQQVTVDDWIYAYPIVIEPHLLVYDKIMFETYGIDIPQNGWNIHQLVEALTLLKRDASRIDYLFSLIGTSIHEPRHLESLIIAYGGLPFDYQTSPPTPQLTEPETINAIQQVLDLAKDGLLDYRQIVLPSGQMPDFMFSQGVMYPTILGMGQYQPQDSYLPIPYPFGDRFIPFSYQIKFASINPATPYPDVCYRWIALLAENADLLKGIPANRSHWNSSDEVEALADYYEAILQSPNIIVQQAAGFSLMPSGSYENRWLYRAFDRYVFEDADLEHELTLAQGYIEEYRACTADIPDQSGVQFEDSHDQQAYVSQYIDCALKVDPTI